jgi:membrane associated rhomboid family serine protease
MTADDSTEVQHSLKKQVLTLGLLVAVFWSVEIVDAITPWQLDAYGIRPRSIVGLWGIVAAPFLHGGFDHLAANTVPFLVLGWLTMVREWWHFVFVTVLATLLGGFGVWLVGASNSVHVGASGVIFGYLGFLLLSGVFERRLGPILVSIVVGLVYGGLVFGVLPSQPGVSWEGHLFGFVAGILAAYVVARRNRRTTG